MSFARLWRVWSLVCSPCRLDRGSAKRRRTLILCALSRFFKVFSTSRILADTMKVSSSDRRSSKSRSTKSIEFSSKNRTEIVGKSGLRSNFAKNASKRAVGVLPDLWERPRASHQLLRGVLGGPWGRPRTSRERPGALPKHPRSVPGAPPIGPNRPQGAPERFFIDFSSIWGRFSMDFALISGSLGRSFVSSFDRLRVLRVLSTFASRAF